MTLEPTRPTDPPPSVCAPTDRRGLRSSAAADRTPPAVGRSALGAQTAKSACSLQDDAHMRRGRQLYGLCFSWLSDAGEDASLRPQDGTETDRDPKFEFLGGPLFFIR